MKWACRIGHDERKADNYVMFFHNSEDKPRLQN
jgi:hypothetical protein